MESINKAKDNFKAIWDNYLKASSEQRAVGTQYIEEVVKSKDNEVLTFTDCDDLYINYASGKYGKHAKVTKIYFGEDKDGKFLVVSADNGDDLYINYLEDNEVIRVARYIQIFNY